MGDLSTLPVVFIPGLAEARAKESKLRDYAFLPLGVEIAGIPVKPFTPLHLLELDAVENGFVVPFIYERPSEKVAHALQFLWYVSYECEIPRGKFHAWIIDRRRKRFINRVKKLDSAEVFGGIREYVANAFYDCPRSSEQNGPPVSYASFMAGLVDNLCEAGYAWSEQEILNIPLCRLWQYLRLAIARKRPEIGLSNPSDRVASAHIAKLNEEAACQKSE